MSPGCGKKKNRKWYCKMCYCTDFEDQPDDNDYNPTEEEKNGPSDFSHVGKKIIYADKERT